MGVAAAPGKNGGPEGLFSAPLGRGRIGVFHLRLRADTEAPGGLT